MTSIEVRRDVDGIAHVRAPDRAGAFFGQGYAAAADRCFQIEADRRRAQGRWAEIVGAAGVASDVLHLRVGLADTARSDVEGLSDDARTALDAYAAGINAWLDQATDDDLPPELGLLGAPRPAPWEPWHSVAVYKYRHLLMGTAQTKIWRSAVLRSVGPSVACRLWPGLGRTDPSTDGVDLDAALMALAAVPTQEAASNNLVVAGTRTASGRPLLAGDPHRSFDLPNVYWQNHITGGEIDVIGLSFPGVPGFPHFAHNRDVAWCITHGMADDQDVYVERAADLELAGIESATIPVAGADPVTVEVATAADGRRVIAGGRAEGWGLSLAWTATAAPDTTFDALVPMMAASSVDELDAAMSPWVVPVNNVLMADGDGTIAYRMRGRLARRDGRNGWTVVPGWTGEHGWVGFVDDDDLPRRRDPDAGFLATANEDLGHHHLYISNDWAHPARGIRIRQLLESSSGWTADTITSDVLGDEVSLVAPAFVSLLTASPDVSGLDAVAQSMLARWDHRMDPDSPAAAIYAACRVALLDVVAAAVGFDGHRLGAGAIEPAPDEIARSQWSRLAVLASHADDDLVTDVGGWAGAARSALSGGVKILVAALGTDPTAWRWGDLHPSAPYHPLAVTRPDLGDELVVPATRELGGDSETVRCTGVSPPSLGAMRGSVARYVFDLGDWDQSRWIVPHGVHGDPRSPHFSDQLDRWASMSMAPMRWSPEVVDGATGSVEQIVGVAPLRGEQR